MSTLYPSDLSDDEWKHLQRYLPAGPSSGRPRTHTLRAICNAIFYVLKTGCPWRYLPSNFPPWQSVFYHFRRWRLKGNWYRLFTALRAAERERVGRNTEPSAAIMDSSSVSRPSRSLPAFLALMLISIPRGASGIGRVATLGLPLSVYVTPADVHDTKGARCLLAGLAPLVPRLKKIWADGAYRGQELSYWCKEEGGWDLEVVERAPGVRGREHSTTPMGGGAHLWLALPFSSLE